MPDHTESYYQPIESASMARIQKEYANSYALLSWLVEAVTTAEALRSSFRTNEISILFGEGIQRFRSSQLLAVRGYASDGLALLRSVFEIVKSINAIHNGCFTCQDYLIGASYAPGFHALPVHQQQRLIAEHNQAIDRKTNTFDGQGLPEAIKPSLRIFKAYLHQSVHKSIFNSTLQLAPFMQNPNFNPFVSAHPIDTFRIYFNTLAMLIAMYMRCMLNGEYLDPTAIPDFVHRIQEIEGPYARMPDDYHPNIVQYIQLRYLHPDYA